MNAEQLGKVLAVLERTQFTASSDGGSICKACDWSGWLTRDHPQCVADEAIAIVKAGIDDQYDSLQKRLKAREEHEATVDAIISDMDDRRGFNFDLLDSDIQYEIRETWIEIVGGSELL